jgi:riboflavin kinase/FMN adenylyltransferase
LVVIEFTFEFSRLKFHEFYERYLVKKIGVSEVVVGYDHMFGRNREGTTEDLVHMGQEFGFSVIALQQYTVDGEVVSSTQVRQAIGAGNMERAKKFLGYDYQMRGTVVQGDGRGRTIGYSTANIEPDSPSKLIPAKGVYFVGVQLDEKKYFGMMNIGVRPTITEEMRRTIEVHIFDFDADIYGRRPVISFLKRLRDEQKFASLEDLVNQLGADKTMSLKYLAEHVNRQY